MSSDLVFSLARSLALSLSRSLTLSLSRSRSRSLSLSLSRARALSLTLHGHAHTGNNAYIFPGIGLGVVAGGLRHVTDDMFRRAARALADQVSCPISSPHPNPIHYPLALHHQPDPKP